MTFEKMHTPYSQNMVAQQYARIRYETRVNTISFIVSFLLPLLAVLLVILT